MRETDWEVTQETIEEQVARESYLQWLRDQEKRAKQHNSVLNVSVQPSLVIRFSSGFIPLICVF